MLLQRLKLQEVQGQLSELQLAYTREKTENTQLKAKVKDGTAFSIVDYCCRTPQGVPTRMLTQLLPADQQQIEYVTSKVSMVETMHDGLRVAMASLRTDVHNGTAYAAMMCCAV